MSKFSDGLRRPRLLAGGTLGLAGIGVAATLLLSGTAATSSAFAVSPSSNGSVLVTMDYNADQNLPQVNQKLAALGTDEAIDIYMGSGPAAAAGSVTCTPVHGASGPVVKVLVGQNGTEVIAPGQSTGNTAAGTFHLVSCDTFPADYVGNSGAGAAS